MENKLDPKSKKKKKKKKKAAEHCQNIVLLQPIVTSTRSTVYIKGCRMGRSEKVSLWYVAINQHYQSTLDFFFLNFRISSC